MGCGSHPREFSVSPVPSEQRWTLAFIRKQRAFGEEGSTGRANLAKKAPENRGQFRKEEETEGSTLLPVFCSRRPCHDRCSWTTSNETGRVNSFRSSLTPLWNKRNSWLATICVSTLSGWGLFSSVQRTSITRLNY